MLPLWVSKTLINVPFSEDVANLVPCKFKAMQDNGVSWASIFTGCFSVLAKSTTVRILNSTIIQSLNKKKKYYE